MEFLTPADLPEAMRSNELASSLIEGVNAKALRVAPCLASDPTTAQLAEARLILLGAIKRWLEGR